MWGDFTWKTLDYWRIKEKTGIGKKVITILTVIQISRIDGCNIKRVGTLEFDFKEGACNTYQFDVEKILFCFGGDSERQCHL